MKLSVAPESIIARKQEASSETIRWPRLEVSVANIDIRQACLSTPTSVEAETASFLTWGAWRMGE